MSDRRSRPSLQDGESGESGEQAEAEQREESEAAADPALTLRVYAHAMPHEESDLSFAEFGGPGRPYTAPTPESAASAEDVEALSADGMDGSGGVSEGTRTPDLQGHNLAL